MTALPKNLYTAQQVRVLDRIAIEDNNIPGYTLMTRAGKAAYALIKKHHKKTNKIAVICGMGNNAGDGFVVARLAHKDKKNVTVLLLGDPQKLKTDALRAYHDLKKTKTRIEPYASHNFSSYDLIVDAIFGSGLSRNIAGNFKKAIQQINKANSPVLAIDIPSGINADTGCVMGIAVKATASISFIGLKQGMFTAEGPEHSGKMFFHDLKVPKQIYDSVFCQTKRMILTRLPKRNKNAHKNKYGHSLIAGGNTGMLGAIQISCSACLKTGSGLVSLATRKSHAPLINKWLPEVMSSSTETKTEIIKQIKKATVIAIGPGLGQDKWSNTVFETCLKKDKPLVVDADALNLLSKKNRKRTNWILTPHPGEAARLLGVTNKTIQNNRFEAVKKLAKKYNAVVVLKGCGSLVCDKDSPVFLCDLGNPGMASGGMGDALTGIITALVAQNWNLLDAAKLGTCLHAKAGDLAAKEGERGLVASDLIAELQKLVN